MGMILANQRLHTGVLARLVERLEREVVDTLQNIKAQQDSWQRFHQTPAGRHVSQRAWMRHGAMLEQLGKRQS